MTSLVASHRGDLYALYVKRAADLIGSVVLLAAAAPVLVLIAGAILITTGRPIFFQQERAGRHGAVFRLYKFRTMKIGTEEKFDNFPTPDAVTPVGRFLRRLSLDELPQLLNILTGAMSFVGPRPALPSQVPRYTDMQRRRLAVRPGLTGLAQVRFRNSAPWSKRIEADIEYIERMALQVDLMIMARTIPKALRGSDQVVGQAAIDVDDLAESAN